MPEWLNGAVSKTVVAFQATEGSNPSLSAKKDSFAAVFFHFFSQNRLIDFF